MLCDTKRLSYYLLYRKYLNIFIYSPSPSKGKLCIRGRLEFEMAVIEWRGQIEMTLFLVCYIINKGFVRSFVLWPREIDWEGKSETSRLCQFQNGKKLNCRTKIVRLASNFKIFAKFREICLWKWNAQNYIRIIFFVCMFKWAKSKQRLMCGNSLTKFCSKVVNDRISRA